MSRLPLEAYRQAFNAQFRQETYAAFLKDLHPTYDPKLDFRVAESPVFVSKEFRKEMMGLFSEIKAFLQSTDLREMAKDAIPPHLVVPQQDEHPYFMCIDFAVCQKPDGSLFPQLIELQGTASLFCYQRRLCQAFRKHFKLPDTLSEYLPGMDSEQYLETLRRIIVADDDPEQVILLDIKPHTQKTRIDFHYTESDLGVRPVCVTDVLARGNRLFYKHQGREIPISRIYNRVIPDELELKRSQLDLKFNWQEDYNLTWRAHPNWFFRVSKYIMPNMISQYVPKSWLLNELEEIPENLDRYVLKPLFSFAGAGVYFDVTPEIVASIDNRSNYLLQEKVDYVSFLPTPEGMAKAEIRMLCVWEDELKPIMHLARLSKGKMIGVDFNKDKNWVGGSAVFFE